MPGMETSFQTHPHSLHSQSIWFLKLTPLSSKLTLSDRSQEAGGGARIDLNPPKAEAAAWSRFWLFAQGRSWQCLGRKCCCVTLGVFSAFCKHPAHWRHRVSTALSDIQYFTGTFYTSQRPYFPVCLTAWVQQERPQVLLTIMTPKRSDHASHHGSKVKEKAKKQILPAHLGSIHS